MYKTSHKNNAALTCKTKNRIVSLRKEKKKRWRRRKNEKIGRIRRGREEGERIKIVGRIRG
jgi:hypothetical protein